MKKAMLLILAALGIVLFGATKVLAQPEASMQPTSTLTFTAYKMNFFESQKDVSALPVAAATPWTIDKEYYTDSAMSKGSDGFINATTSWSNIPAEVAQTSADENILAGLTLGFGKGLAAALTRGAAGIVDMTTCVFPPYDKPLAEPQYSVQNPEKDGYKVAIFKW